jgi:hypothetical protein
MDIVKQLAACSTSSVPYRYDLGTVRNCSISYFVDNGLGQGFLCTQDGGPSVSEAQAGITSERSGNAFP